MKNLLVLMVIVLAGCAPDENTPTVPVDDDFNPYTATRLKMGSFEGLQVIRLQAWLLRMMITE
jgi:hypothetical protein